MQIHSAVPQRRLFRLVVCCLVMVCLVSVLSKTVFAQTTYLITDGDTTTVYTSSLSDLETVLDKAGHGLGEGDRYTATETAEGTEIIIQRAYAVEVNNCGKPMTVYTFGETVEELLMRLGIADNGSYRFSLPLDTRTFDGMRLEIVLVQAWEETYLAQVPFRIAYAYDPLLPAGQEKILVEGKPGKVQRTDAVVYENHVEMSRVSLEEKELTAAVTQYVLVGTGENVGARRTKPLIGDGFILTPDGQVLTFSHSDQFHATAYTHTDEGCDFTTATGTTVRVGTVAVDPRVVPYFTKMYIVSNDAVYVYGVSRAEDCGGAIQGNRIDLYFPTDYECVRFGRRDCTVYFLTD